MLGRAKILPTAEILHRRLKILRDVFVEQPGDAVVPAGKGRFSTCRYFWVTWSR